MGNSLCRIILGRDVDPSAVLTFAEPLRAKLTRPTKLHVRDLSGRSVRIPSLVAARDAGVRVVDIEPETVASTVEMISNQTIGSGRFVIRIVDDEGTDVT